MTRPSPVWTAAFAAVTQPIPPLAKILPDKEGCFAILTVSPRSGTYQL